MNIHLRLTLWYTTILMIILIIFSVVVYVGLSRSLFSAIDVNLRREAQQIIRGLDSEHADEMEAEYLPEEGIYWRVLSLEGQPVLDPGHFSDNLINASQMESDQTHYTYTNLTNGTPVRLYSVVFSRHNHKIGIVQVAESYAQVISVQQQLLFLFALGIPITLLAASIGGWFLAARALTPIDRITRAAQQISATDLHQRLALKLPNDEVGRLASTFDQMLARLEDAFERQKRFIADASHEMRTPLTILKGDVEVALNRPRTVEQYQETLKLISQTSDRLTSLVQELFLLARADNNQYPLNITRLNLAEVLTKEVSSLMPQALKKEVELNLDTPDDLFIEGDIDKLSRLFLNLIDNAIKYSTAGDQVTIKTATKNNSVYISISDTGPGIPPENLPQLFERFYRVDKARSRQNSHVTSGAGLGLSIAQLLAHLHRGEIKAASEVGQGTTFTVRLPLKII